MTTILLLRSGTVKGESTRNVSGSVNYVRYISQARRNLEELILDHWVVRRRRAHKVCFTYKSTNSRRLSFKLLGTRAFGKNKYTNSDFQSATILNARKWTQMLVIGGEILGIPLFVVSRV